MDLNMKRSQAINLLNTVLSKGAIGILIILYLIPFLLFKYSTFIQRSLLFMNNFNKVNVEYLSEPEKLGFITARLLRVSHSDNEGLDQNQYREPRSIELGGWHILPKSRCLGRLKTPIDEKIAFADSRPIILYVHGNGGTRANEHRIQMYKRLAIEFDFHVVTFDYRGFGDSSYLKPTANGLTSDASVMYNWLLKQPNVKISRILVWSHSLGTAVAVRMISQLPDSIQPKGLVLEAPFDAIGNAVASHPYCRPFKIIPYYEYFLVDPVRQSVEMNFDSTEVIGNIKKSTIIIVHAEDDELIPFDLGRNLYDIASTKLGQSRVKFLPVDSCHKAGHNLIYSHDDTMCKVRSYVEKLLK